MTHDQARKYINAARNLHRPLPTRAQLDEAYFTLPGIYQAGCACFAVALAIDIAPRISLVRPITIEEC